MDAERSARQHQFLVKLDLIKAEAASLGFFRTMHKLDAAAVVAEFEAESLITGEPYRGDRYETARNKERQ